MIENTRILLVAALLLKIISLLVKPTGAIIGGAAVTDFSAYSWMGYVDVYDPVTLKHRSSCGGTVIDPQYILTSAHCFFNAGHSQPANFSIISLGTGKSKFDYPKERVEVQGFPVRERASIFYPLFFLEINFSHFFSSNSAILQHPVRRLQPPPLPPRRGHHQAGRAD